MITGLGFHTFRYHLRDSDGFAERRILQFGHNLKSIEEQVCQRRTKCKLCDEFMQKGERRYLLTFKLPYVRTFTKGGKAYNSTMYCHPHCWLAIFKPAPKRKPRCSECGSVETKENRLNLLPINDSLYKVCRQCLTPPKFLGCEICSHWYFAKDVSHFIRWGNTNWRPFSHEDKDPNMVCVNCACNHNIWTSALESRQRDAEISFEARYQRLLNRVELEGVWKENA